MAVREGRRLRLLDHFELLESPFYALAGARATDTFASHLERFVRFEVTGDNMDLVR